MKKLISVIFIFIICISVSACGADLPFRLDLSFWRQPKASKTVQPFMLRGNMASVTVDSSDMGGKYISSCLEDLPVVPADGVDISVYDVPQLVYQLEFIKYHGEKVGGWMPVENYEYIYVIRFYNDFQYMAVFSDKNCENMISPVYYIEDATLVREYFLESSWYMTEELLADIKTFMENNFTGKGRDYLRQYVSDTLKGFFMQDIPRDIVFMPDYNRMYTFYRDGKPDMIMGFMDFKEDVYSYNLFIDTDENGRWHTERIMFLLFEDNTVE